MTTSTNGDRGRMPGRQPSLSVKTAALAGRSSALVLGLVLFGHAGAALASPEEVPSESDAKATALTVPPQTFDAAPPSAAAAPPLVAFSGEVGLTNFDYRNYFHALQDTHDLAVGGHLLAHTRPLSGFSAGLGVYTGQTLGLEDRDSPAYNVELASADGNRTTLRQAYVQYQDDRLLVRAGRQLIQTPFATQDFFTFHPRAYSGFAARYDVKGRSSASTAVGPMSLDGSDAEISVMAVRMYEFAGRFADDFTEGSEVSGGRDTDGFYAFGARYNGRQGDTGVVAQGWYYDFIDYAQLAYGHLATRTPVGDDREFLAAFQVVREWSSGDGAGLRAATNGNASEVDAQIYGASVGGRIGDFTLSAIGNYAPDAAGAFRNGALLQPYTMIPYTLFTDTLQTGLAELGPGYGYGLNLTFKALEDRFTSSISAVRYKARYGYGKSFYSYVGPLGFGGDEATPDQTSWALDAINNLDLSSIQPGLSASYVIGLAHTENRPDTPRYENLFVISRLYLKLAF